MTDVAVLIPWRYDIRGIRDPNADAKDRTEAELLALILVILAGQRVEIHEAIEEIGEVPDTLWVKLKTRLADRVRPVLQVAAWTAALRLLGRLLRRIPFAQTLASFAVEEWAWEYTASLTTMLMGITQGAVDGLLTTGETPIGSTDLDFYFSRARADEISVTQTTEAFTGGERAVVTIADEYGLQTEAVWHTMRDELVCEVCAPRDGEPEGEWGIMPGFPPLHERCRCWVTYAGIGDYPPGRWLPGEDRPHVGLLF